jgi:hypothetical protein
MDINRQEIVLKARRVVIAVSTKRCSQALLLQALLSQALLLEVNLFASRCCSRCYAPHSVSNIIGNEKGPRLIDRHSDRASWQRQRRSVLIYFDNDQKAAAPKDAARLVDMLRG